MLNPFLIAAKNNQFQLLNIFIENQFHLQFNINEIDEDGKNLSYYILNNLNKPDEYNREGTEILSKLISAGLDVFSPIRFFNKTINQKTTKIPASFCYHIKSPETLSLLFKNKKKSFIQEFILNHNLYQNAIKEGNIECVKWILNQNININSLSKLGNPPLFFCKHNHMLEFLLSHKIDLYLKDNNNVNGLDFLTQNKYYYNNYELGNTPKLSDLMEIRATLANHLKKLSSNAKPDILEMIFNMINGKSILEASEIKKLMNLSDINPHDKDKDGFSIIYKATMNKHFNVIKIMTKNVDLLDMNSNEPYIISLLNNSNKNNSSNVQSILSFLKKLTKEQKKLNESGIDFFRRKLPFNLYLDNGELFIEQIIKKSIDFKYIYSALSKEGYYTISDLNQLGDYKDNNSLWHKPPVDKNGKFIGNILLKDLFFTYYMNNNLNDREMFNMFQIISNSHASEKDEYNNFIKSISFFNYYVINNYIKNTEQIIKMLDLIRFEKKENTEIDKFIINLCNTNKNKINIIKKHDSLKNYNSLNLKVFFDKLELMQNLNIDNSIEKINKNTKRL